MHQVEPISVLALPGGPIEIESLIAMLEESTRLWREELAALSDDAVAWQPFKNGHSIGGLLLHVAEVEGRWVEEIAAGRSRSDEEGLELRTADTDPSQERWPVPYPWPIERYYQLLDRVRVRSVATLRELGDSSRVVQSSEKGPVTLAWIVTYLINHEAYHAGQMMLHKLHQGWNGVEPN